MQENEDKALGNICYLPPGVVGSGSQPASSTELVTEDRDEGLIPSCAESPGLRAAPSSR